MKRRNHHLHFGNENAESDQLLIPCQVRKQNPEEYKPILIGRWGVGKTALLLIQNQEQSKLLKNLDPEYERIWYLSESSLDIFALARMKNQHEDEPDIFIKSLEEIWKSEICRIYTLILARASKLYRNNQGEHWQSIRRIARTNTKLLKSIWHQVPEVLDILVHSKAGSFSEVRDSVNVLVRDTTYQNIIRCLRDIDEDEYLPSIVVEPIETPTSALEKHKGLAQYLIIALLNAFHKYFSPDDRNFNVRISIPWHRYVVKETDFPQKLYQHKGSVEWSKEKLKEFISKRIEWEFRRVGRRYSIPTNKSAWNILFDDKVENGWCHPVVAEDSFDYFLRHTHYRARDILRLARETLIEAAKQMRMDVDEVLKTERISAKIITSTFHKVGQPITKQLIEEGNRRFPGLAKVTDRLSGLPLPFTTDELKKRLKPLDIPFNDAIHMLWESGILGVMLEPNSDKASRRLALGFTERGKRVYTNKLNQRHEIWTWFEHNHEGTASEILSKLTQMNCGKFGLVLHPKTFELFFPNPAELHCPIGC
ncbi:MAG: hypothetical protein AAF206_00335 [Bacteroidota bacterium]